MNDNNKQNKVAVVGAGMAGVEAAFFLAEKGLEVLLFESKRVAPNPAQKTPLFAELVCTNSLKSTEVTSGHGLLKIEMDKLGSLVLQQARKAAVPAGSALAVDRELFSGAITEIMSNHPNIRVYDKEVANPIELATEFGLDHVIIASGPLTNKPLEQWIQSELTSDDFYFYDAIAPVVDGESLDYTQLYFKDRHCDYEDGDYLNCPLNKEQYYHFVNELLNAKKVPPQGFEEYQFFEGCLPVDLMAERGIDTPRFSCMKPIGLARDSRPYAVIQLRKENFLGSAFNMVGFQNRLTYSEQVRVFQTLPGFSHAKFFHLGSVHRNSFLNTPKVLDFDMSCYKFPQVSFAGQITGVEGYTESASSGLYVAWQVWHKLCYPHIDKESLVWPVETAIGAMIHHILSMPRPVPTNMNFGLFPPVNQNLPKQIKGKRADRRAQKKEAVIARSFQCWQSYHEKIDSVKSCIPS